jgi:rSAM/selenodomain-associated transferase 2
MLASLIRPEPPAAGGLPAISVIVPIRSEDATTAERLVPLLESGEAELIVVSRGPDPPAEQAFRLLRGSVLHVEGNRGLRLDRGARSATGQILFFLHADSRPPENALGLIRRCIQEGAAAGAFSLSYEGAGPALRWIAFWANVRTRLLRLPFGDQGLFCRREAYERAGGFRDLPICDDLDLVRRLKRCGRFVILPQPMVTSPRRYLERGALQQVLTNWKVLAGYYLGVSPERLARWYNAR